MWLRSKGENVKELKENFAQAVDEYLSFCEAEGETPSNLVRPRNRIVIPTVAYPDFHFALLATNCVTDCSTSIGIFLQVKGTGQSL